MTSTAHPPPPVLPWHRRVAWAGLGWGVLELGAVLWMSGPMFSGDASFARTAAVTFFSLSALVTLLLPVGPLLLRRRLHLAAYQLAVLPPALGTLFFGYWLFILSMAVMSDQDLDLAGIAVALASSLARGAVAAALLSASRHRARLYGQPGGA